MRILTLDQFADTPPDYEFGPSKRTPLAVCLVATTIGLISICFAAGIIPHGRINGVVVGMLSLFAIVIAGMANFIAYLVHRQHRAHPFWLCRIAGHTLWIRCALEQNTLIIEMDTSELRWVQPFKLTYLWKSSLGGRQYEFYPYLEIGLSEEATTRLEQFVHDEGLAPDVRQQILPTANIYNLPARRIRPGVLRLYWQGISPGLSGAGRIFSKWSDLRPIRRERLTND